MSWASLWGGEAGGRGFKGGGHMHPWPIYIYVWQNPPQNYWPPMIIYIEKKMRLKVNQKYNPPNVTDTENILCPLAARSSTPDHSLMNKIRRQHDSNLWLKLLFKSGEGLSCVQCIQDPTNAQLHQNLSRKEDPEHAFRHGEADLVSLCRDKS